MRSKTFQNFNMNSNCVHIYNTQLCYLVRRKLARSLTFVEENGFGESIFIVMRQRGGAFAIIFMMYNTIKLKGFYRDSVHREKSIQVIDRQVGRWRSEIVERMYLHIWWLQMDYRTSCFLWIHNVSIDGKKQFCQSFTWSWQINFASHSHDLDRQGETGMIILYILLPARGKWSLN